MSFLMCISKQNIVITASSPVRILTNSRALMFQVFFVRMSDTAGYICLCNLCISVHCTVSHAMPRQPKDYLMKMMKMTCLVQLLSQKQRQQQQQQKQRYSELNGIVLLNTAWLIGVHIWCKIMGCLSVVNSKTSMALVVSLSKMLYPHCSVLVGSRNSRNP